MAARKSQNQPFPADPDGAFPPLLERALEWQVALHSGAATAGDLTAYESWRTASPEQNSAAAEAEELWQALGPASHPAASSRAKALVGGILALGLFAALAGGGLLGSPSVLLADQHTATGERRSLTLADGSRLDMDADTAIDVKIGESGRRVTLHGGRIHVTVAPDPRRPFDVEAAGGVVRALGTAFDVMRRGEQVQVTVTEHAVAVSYAGDPRTSQIRVAAGQQIGFDPERGLGRPTQTRIEDATAWLHGRVTFDGQTLAGVLRETERYRSGVVIVTDARLRDMPVTGVFDTTDPESMLTAIAEGLPVKLLRLPWITLIRPGQS